MPGVSVLLGEQITNDGELDGDAVPEAVPLLLPSHLSQAQRTHACVPELAHKELRLRYAQANDALCDLRRLRRMYVGMIDRHKKQTLGTSTRTNTRVNTVLRGFKARIMRSADRYRAARTALGALDPKEETFQWRDIYLPLHDADIRGPGKDDEEELTKRKKPQPREGQYKPSWIWLSRAAAVAAATSSSIPGTTSSTSTTETSNLPSAMSEEEVHECMQVEWAKAMARAERYEEEVQLLVEEMRRTLAFFEWHAAEWRGRSATRSFANSTIARGAAAYAERQAVLRERMISRSVGRWIRVLQQNDLGSDWLPVYLHYHPSPNHPTVPSLQQRNTDPEGVDESDGSNSDSDLESDGEQEVLLNPVHISESHEGDESPSNEDYDLEDALADVD